MKNLWIILAAAWLLSACGREPERAELTQRIEYDVLINNQGTMDPWMNHVEGPARLDFLSFLFDQLNKGNAFDMNGNPLSPNSVLNTIRNLNPDLDSSLTDPSAMIRNEIIVINHIRFREKWIYFDDDYRIEKTVLAVAPVMQRFDSTQRVIEHVPLFWVNCDTSGEWTSGRLLTEHIISDAIIQNQLDPIRAIDTNPKSWYCNIENAPRSAYFEAVLASVIEKKQPTYDYFFKELTDQELEKLKGYDETIPSYDDNNNVKNNVVHHAVSSDEFGKIKFAEKWEYSLSPFKFRKTVMGINPSVFVIDQQYEVLKGFKPLFWILFDESYLEKMKKIYPE